jgi:hypothetical protein
MRVCKRHGLVEFHEYGAGGGTRRLRCRRCVGEAVNRRHRRLRATLVGEARGRCCICGYDRCILNLHFHHVRPEEKAFPMTVSSGKSIAAYRAEARKCILVCANCHGEIEAGLVASPPPGARYRGDG